MWDPHLQFGELDRKKSPSNICHCPNLWYFSHWANKCVTHKVTDATHIHTQKCQELFWSFHLSNSRHGGPMQGRRHAGYRLDLLLLQVPFGSSAKSANAILDENTKASQKHKLHCVFFQRVSTCDILRSQAFTTRKHDHHVGKKDIRRTCFRQTAPIRTLIFAGAPNASTDIMDEKDHLQATMVLLKEWKSLTKKVIWEREGLKGLWQSATNKANGVWQRQTRQWKMRLIVCLAPSGVSPPKAFRYAWMGESGLVWFPLAAHTQQLSTSELPFPSLGHWCLVFWSFFDCKQTYTHFFCI